MSVTRMAYLSEHQYKQMLHALQMAYRKHHLGDESIGWTELSGVLHDALCEAMGDEEFQRWIEEVKP